MSSPSTQVDRPSKLRIWIQAIRPATLTAGVVPVLVGSSLAYAHEHFQWSIALAAMMAAFAVQVMTNLHKLRGFCQGADTDERLGQARLFGEAGSVPTNSRW